VIVELSPRKFAVPEFVLGSGASGLLPGYITRFGSKRVLLVSDEGLVKTGLVDRLVASMRGEGLIVEVYTGISPNPRSAEVRNGAAVYEEKGCEVIAAAGGGSVMDAAKGIGFMATNKRDILSFEGIDEVELPGPPLICIPTTSGTAADISQFAVINDTDRRTKIAIVSKKAIPDVALIDPDVTVTMSPELTAATGMDALTHAFEAHVSRAASPVCAVQALKAVSLCGQYLKRAVRDGKDQEARNGMTMASLFAGMAFSNAGLGAVHALAHPLGGQLDLPHGICNALLLEQVCAYNYPDAPAGYGELARSLAEGLCADGFCAQGLCAGGDENVKREAESVLRSKESPDADALLGLLAGLRSGLPLPKGLGEAGLSSEHIPELARKAWMDACLVTNPRKPDGKDLEALYARSL